MVVFISAGGFWLSGFRVSVTLHLRPAALSWGSCVGKSSGDLLPWLWDYKKTIAGVWMLLVKFWKGPFFPVTVVWTVPVTHEEWPEGDVKFESCCSLH